MKCKETIFRITPCRNVLTVPATRSLYKILISQPQVLYKTFITSDAILQVSKSTQMKTIILLAATQFNSRTDYVIGAVIALFIFAYLVYSLVKPEKF